MSGDYTQAGLWFKVRKAARYVRLYGLSRTLIKVKGQYHMKATAGFDGDRWENPRCATPDAPERSVALIGCGNYAFSNICYYLKKQRGSFLRATYDVERSRARSLCEAFGGAYAAADWRSILTDEHVQLVFVASNHFTHAEYAIECLEAGKHVHIEKPHVVTEDQLERLLTAMRRHPSRKVFLGFNRPKGRLFRALQKVLQAEGGPLMINWFIGGHAIPEGHWYFDEKEGGRVLGNLCHWSDLTLHLVGMDKAFPCTIVPATPAGSTSDFVVSMIFADKSCGCITFSAKGHTFEGVRETLNVHKGDVLATLEDFQVLRSDIVEKKKRVSLVHRNHGHGENIIHSLVAATTDEVPGESADYVGATARLFLAIRRAIDTGETIVVPRGELQ